MTHAHAMREGCCRGEPADWREMRRWLAMAARGRGGPRGFGEGPGRHGPGGHRGRHRGRRPRGDVRAAILVLLDEEARNGYGIMQEIEERSAGAWRPSPGSVYPVLQQLEDEGLVHADESGERKLMALTDEGREYVDERREAPGDALGHRGGRSQRGDGGVAHADLAGRRRRAPGGRPAGPTSSTPRPATCSPTPGARSTGSWRETILTRPRRRAVGSAVP